MLTLTEEEAQSMIMLMRGIIRFGKAAWKLMFFLVITFVTALIGLYYNISSGADITLPGEEARTTVTVYVDDPLAHVDLGLVTTSPIVLSRAPSKETAIKDFQLLPMGGMDIFLKVVAPNPKKLVHWLIRMEGLEVHRIPGNNNQLDADAAGIPTGNIPLYIGGQYGSGPSATYVIAGDTEKLAPNVDPNSRLLTGEDGLSHAQHVDIPLFDDKNPAGYAARLPQIIGIPSSVFPNTIPLLAVELVGAKHPSALIQLPYRSLLSSPKGATVTTLPDNVPPGMLKTRYYYPASQRSSEVLINGDFVLTGAQITTLVPPNPSLSTAGMEWTADGNLAPILQTSDVAYARAASSDDFFAGLAFATAAATFVAAVQEIGSIDRKSVKGNESRKKEAGEQENIA